MLSLSNIEDYLHFYCAPCLLGQKSANLFCAPLHENMEIQNQQNTEFFIKGNNLVLKLLYVLKQNACFILYSKEKMDSLFERSDVCDAFSFFGYTSVYKNTCVIKYLFEKLEQFAISADNLSPIPASAKKERKVEFPHEVGLILGYPPQDVIQYYINKGQSYIFSGYWKVYTNPEWAISQFKNYDKARNYCMKNRII